MNLFVNSGRAASAFRLLLAAAFVLSTAVAFFGPGADAQGKKAAPRGALTVKVAGVAKGSAVQITISGPRQKGKAFKKTISTAGVKGFRGLALGRYRVSAKASQVGEGLATPSKAQQALTLSKKKSKGTVTVTYTVQAATPSPPAPAQPTPATPGGGTTPPADTAQPLRFSVAGAVGLATTQEVTGSTRARNGATAPESNLQAVYSSGQVTNAISSGRAKINDFVAGPDGKLYVTFSPPVNLADARQDPEDFEYPEPDELRNYCAFAEIDRSSGIPSCVDPEVEFVVSPNSFNNPSIQFGPSGELYYLAGIIGSNIQVRKREEDGSITRVTEVLGPAAELFEFLALPDESILVSGYGPGTGFDPWIQRFRSDGSYEDVWRGGTSPTRYLFRFSDGDVYIGMTDYPNTGVAKYSVASAGLLPNYWIGPGTASPTPTWNATTLCANNTLPIQFCQFGYGSSSEMHIQSGGRDFVVDEYVPGLVQLYPNPARTSSGVTQIAAAAGLGNKIVLAGRNSGGRYTLTLYDASTDTEEVILESVPGGESYEFYNLDVIQSANKAIFDVQVFSENKYRYGELDLDTGEVTLRGQLAGRWSKFQGLP